MKTPYCGFVVDQDIASKVCFIAKEFSSIVRCKKIASMAFLTYTVISALVLMGVMIPGLVEGPKDTFIHLYEEVKRSMLYRTYTDHRRRCERRRHMQGEVNFEFQSR